MEEYNRQEILDKAAEAYFHAEATIRALDGAFSQTSGRTYDAEETLARFDVILQGVLLSVAIADGVFDSIEQDFINQFAIHGDLLKFIAEDFKDKMGKETMLTWKIISMMPEDLVNDLVRILPLMLDRQCEEFAYPLAAADVEYSRSGKIKTPAGIFLKSIENDMIRIAELLASVDKDETQKEDNAATVMIYELSGKHWRDIISGKNTGSGSDTAEGNS